MSAEATKSTPPPPASTTVVTLATEDLAWAQARADRQGTTVSAVVTEAIRRQRQNEARERLLADLGTDDLTEAELAAVEAEWR